MDFCCGTTMAARLAPFYSDGRALLTDVPFLVCSTCGRSTVAPGVELDVAMYSHYCETDGLQTASLYDVVDKTRVEQILAEYPSAPDSGPIVTEEQIDHQLDLWNLASELNDRDWLAEIRDQLNFLLNVRSQAAPLQKQIQPIAWLFRVNRNSATFAAPHEPSHYAAPAAILQNTSSHRLLHLASRSQNGRMLPVAFPYAKERRPCSRR